MSLFIAGSAWVTPLGSGTAEVWNRLLNGEEAQPEIISESISDRTYPVFRVPSSALENLPRHPRLRRASAISKFAAAAGLSRLQQMTVSDATIFTARLSEEPFARQKVAEFTDTGVFIGWVAREIGAQITCLRGGGITVINSGAKEGIWLPQQHDVHYEITIDNNCPIAIGSDPDAPSDFVLYYDAVEDDSGVRYDLRRAVPKGDPRAKARIKGTDDWLVDAHLVMCDGAYLSRTSEWS